MFDFSITRLLERSMFPYSQCDSRSVTVVASSRVLVSTIVVDVRVSTLRVLTVER